MKQLDVIITQLIVIITLLCVLHTYSLAVSKHSRIVAIETTAHQRFDTAFVRLTLKVHKSVI